jgi:translation initiation factor 1 (eIF-1/SUI1)
MGELLYTAEAKDQGKALDECVEWARTKYQLVSIIWLKEEEGKHVFTIHYIDVQSADNSNPDVQKS